MYQVIKTEKLWLESNAVDQLKAVSQLPHVVTAIGLPDIHPGKNAPVGVCIAAKDYIYPSLIGNDIGCGFSCFQVTNVSNLSRLAKLATRFKQGETTIPLPEELSDLTEGYCTLGLGNHFIELGQAVSGPLKGKYILTVRVQIPWDSSFD
jgi:release factor H-coupled RctB family protein